MAVIIGKVSIPKSAYSMYDIAKYEKIRHEALQSMMKDTFDMLMELSPVKSAYGIVKYFNAVGRYDALVNRFSSDWRLQPFCKGIKLTFEEAFRNDKLKKCSFITFYVDKKDYELWKTKGIKYTEAPDAEVPTVKQAATIEKVYAVLPSTDMVQHFKDTVTKLGYTFPEAVSMALDYFMQKHIDIFGSNYKEPVKESHLSDNNTALITAYISPELKNKVWKMLQRYNSVNFPGIKLSDFVENAIAEKLAKVPVQYTNPQLFSEYQESIKKNEALEREYHETEVKRE